MRPTKVSEQAVADWLQKSADNGGWTVVAGKLHRTFTFADFAEALAFGVRVGCLAEKRDHHPDLAIRWGACEVFWNTHDAGGLTELDFELAELTSKIAA
jgi:4a-hydroxytetrahydrobiopterin dehydratase